MVRCLTQQRQFAAAHRELDEAASNVPGNVEPYTVHVMRTGIAPKAKQPELAQQHLDAALATIEEPTAIWMQMSCTAVRYKCAGGEGTSIVAIKRPSNTLPPARPLAVWPASSVCSGTRRPITPAA